MTGYAKDYATISMKYENSWNFPEQVWYIEININNNRESSELRVQCHFSEIRASWDRLKPAPPV